ncbi:MAG: WG repeat-containing protein [Candidatus Melainabacteria bacterium]|nr:WG repeat-containing protein [Candidatus Melainabacteria bacterium]
MSRSFSLPELRLACGLARTMRVFVCSGLLMAAVLLLAGFPTTAQSVNSRLLSPPQLPSRQALIDRTGKIRQLPYNSVTSFHEGLAVVEKDQYFGFIDSSGKIAIPIQFTSAGEFACGLAPVARSANSAISYIDRRGREVIPPRFPVSNQFCDNYLTTSIGESTVLVDLKGNVIRQATAEELKRIDFSRDYDTVVFAQKLVQVKRQRYRELTLPAGMQPISRVSEGLCSVQYGPGFEYFDFVDKAGKQVTHGRFVGVNDFKEGLAVVMTTSKKFGYIDKAGKFVVPALFDEAHDFSEGLAAVRIGRRTFYIDKQGRTALKPGYYQAGEFSEGLAPVGKYGKFGYIDKTGKLVIDYQFQDAGTFQNGAAVVTISEAAL